MALTNPVADVSSATNILAIPQRVIPVDLNGNAAATAAANASADGVATTAIEEVAIGVYNGTTVDRLKGDNTGAARVSLYAKNSAAGDTPLICDSSGNAGVNVAKMNSVTVLMGNGASGTGAQRVTIANDSTGQVKLAAGTAFIGSAALTDGTKATYSAAKVGLVPAGSATDIFTVTGSGTTTVRVTRITITATTTSATPAALDVLLVKRSTANSGGTSTGSPTPVPHDSTNAAVTATVLSYTANPTTGNLVGTAIRNAKLFQTLATYTATDFPAKDQIIWEFGNRASQAIVLRGTGEVLAVNLNAASATGTASFDIDVEFTEE